jgi:Protein of unknown function (DUF1091)
MIIFTIFKTDSGKKLKILQIPKLNYCDFRRSGDVVPVLSDLSQFAGSFGNLIFKCPAQPGNFYIKDLPLNLLPIWTLVPKGNFQFVVSFTDENNVKKPVNFLKVGAFVTQN